MNKLYLKNERLFSMRYFLVLIIFLISKNLLAQKANYKNEIGISFFSMQYATAPSTAGNCARLQPLIQVGIKNLNCFRQVEYYTSPALFYKTRIYKNLSFRAGGYFEREKVKIQDFNYDRTSSIYGTYTSDNYRLFEGLQYSFFKNYRLQPYLAFDIVLNYKTAKFLKNNNPPSEPIDKFDPELSLIYRTSAGLNYRFHSNWSTSIESSFLSNSKYFSPISRLSINYHF